MRVTHQIEISPTSVVLDGQTIAVEAVGDAMLVELYRRYVCDYPKFFKMDTLSRLGFVAADILLKETKVDAVILANRSASIKNDNDYLATISEGRYYPSPALFVYTLPNIVTGEIAIRHHIQGETSFYVLDKPEDLDPIIRATMSNDFQSSNLQTVLAGWVECSEPNRFYAKLQIIWNN